MALDVVWNQHKHLFLLISHVKKLRLCRAPRLCAAIRGKWRRLASAYDKANDHRRASGSPHLFLVSMETRTGMFGGTQEPRIDRHKGREKHASCYWHFTDSGPDVFTPPRNQSVV